MKSCDCHSGLTIECHLKEVAEGKTDPLSWWKSCTARIHECEPVVKAWESLFSGTPELDVHRANQPLYGVPVGIKDIIDTANFPTSWGTRGYLQSSSSLVDAALVTLLQEQGALIMGKTVSTEFAYLPPGKTCNPHDPLRTPGGSSSGSAAAVASGMVPLAFGTQTAGSIIRPASYCGVFGFKPTFNTLSLAGVKSFAPSLDTLGWFANTTEDLCTTFSALTRAPRITADDNLAGVRVGVHSLPGTYPCLPEDDAKHALNEATRRFEEAGAEVVPIALDERYEALVEHQKVVMGYEAAQTLGSEYALFSSHMGPELVELIQGGRAVGYSRYREALLAVASVQQALTDEVFEHQVDVILAASAAGEAPHGLDGTGDPLFCRAWTLLGVPCVNLPLGRGESGMPVGVQAVADRWQDQRLLKIVHTLLG